ncbi:hypothetical protein O181_086590 [Austropuccinia psidii MF-1]|uniref:CRIB domain-containing protein n=1 Tax=Austropuccinia psidii MF-1 TaxID=1389203 RepID=A0A9Q3FZI7_9BASI|nr:hypothetical protein [Austropuccinia psidii MF-1]
MLRLHLPTHCSTSQQLSPLFFALKLSARTVDCATLQVIQPTSIRLGWSFSKTTLSTNSSKEKRLSFKKKDKHLRQAVGMKRKIGTPTNFLHTAHTGINAVQYLGQQGLVNNPTMSLIDIPQPPQASQIAGPPLGLQTNRVIMIGSRGTSFLLQTSKSDPQTGHFISLPEPSLSSKRGVSLPVQPKHVPISALARPEQEDKSRLLRASLPNTANKVKRKSVPVYTVHNNIPMFVKTSPPTSEGSASENPRSSLKNAQRRPQDNRSCSNAYSGEH